MCESCENARIVLRGERIPPEAWFKDERLDLFKTACEEYRKNFTMWRTHRYLDAIFLIKELVQDTQKHREENVMLEVIVQKWEESEAGWGTRPDGYSLHLTDNDRKKFVKEYLKSMHGSASHEYSRLDGTAYIAFVDDEIYEKVKASKNGIRCFGKPPGNGGSNDWIWR
jgi:hypothetical protein